MKPDVGQAVRVRPFASGDEWTTGKIALASRNGRSLGIRLDGPVRSGRGITMNFLPLSANHDRKSFMDLMGYEYEVEFS